MLLHDSLFHTANKLINATHHAPITIAYSPLFHSTFTFILSIFGLLFNFICCIKIWLILHQHRERKSKTIDSSNESIHILSHPKYRFLLILTGNDVLLCLSSIISCLDEKYFYQSFLARHHLCAGQVLIWKFTLHLIPLLIIAILCRYHYILKKDLQFKLSTLSAFTQLLCTDLSILIPVVLALAWSVDGLWLWGEANIKDFLHHSQMNEDNEYFNETTNANFSVINSEESNRDKPYLSEQEIICYFQTNHNLNFTVRLVHLIQADFLLLFSLHLISLCLEIALHIRLCCCVMIQKLTLTFNQERQLCIYILYIFMIITLTSLPFYFSRTIEIVFDTQLTSINSQTFAQILLFGCCLKPLLVFLLFFPSSVLFKLKCYLKCYSPVNIQILDQGEEMLTVRNNENLPMMNTKRHRYSLFTHSTSYRKSSKKLRSQSTPMVTITTDQRQGSLAKSDHVNSWLHLTNAFITDKSKETTNTEIV